MNGRHHVFVYGTLKRGQANAHVLDAHVLDAARHVADAVVVGPWELMDLGVFPAVVRLTGARNTIRGELYEINDATLFRLDALEGCPRMYQRVTVPVCDAATGKRITVAWMYVLKRANLPSMAKRVTTGEWKGRSRQWAQ